jgi:hypothetical protein
VIPYREFALADVGRPLDVDEIIIGPNPDPTQARKSVENLAEAREVRCKGITQDVSKLVGQDHEHYMKQDYQATSACSLFCDRVAKSISVRVVTSPWALAVPMIMSVLVS